MLVLLYSENKKKLKIIFSYQLCKNKIKSKRREGCTQNIKIEQESILSSVTSEQCGRTGFMMDQPTVMNISRRSISHNLGSVH